MTEATGVNVQVAGFKLRGQFYPLEVSEHLGDAPLIEMVCGITMHEWRRRQIEQVRRSVEDSEFVENYPDELISLGTIAMAIAREHPTWSRAKIAELIQTVESTEVEIVLPQQEVKESPPVDGASGSTTTSDSSETSRSDNQTSEESPTPETSGPSTLPTSLAAP